ncbi:MAG TPA: AAA family ATPase [Amycolatopsis sp.]|uniref:AAA family ATPase n=1 Tax=Amycolatopsis sp. TaxID=37632 RepID=UPI002F3F8347
MRFIVVGQEREVPIDYEGAILMRDNWNDYNFLTTFELRIKKRTEWAVTVGIVRIAHVDMAVNQQGKVSRTAALLPSEFESLDEKFFSLSLVDTYYTNLNALGRAMSAEILTSLRDVAYASRSIPERLSNLDVFRQSLIRDVPHPDAEVERLHLIAHGRDRVVDFQWSYTPPQPDGTDREPPTLEFLASPGSLPPSNVHALIGRNGVGKTRLLQAMAHGVASAAIEITQTAVESAKVTTNVVVVSFSAFDAFDELLQASGDSPRVTYIGLRDEQDPQRLKTREDLSAEFVKSLATARVGARGARWKKILHTLQYAGSGFLEDFSGDLDGLLREGTTTKFDASASELFQPLSSGHKIALLTLTRLVEKVTERTIVFLDEPEAHLQPPLLSAFVRALSDFLSDVNGMAVMATHSPVVLQEVPNSCVYKLRRYGSTLTADRPQMQTYGENVSELTHEAFGLESTATGFYAALQKQVADGRSYQEIIDDFDSLGSEARGLLRVLTFDHGSPSA